MAKLDLREQLVAFELWRIQHDAKHGMVGNTGEIVDKYLAYVKQEQEDKLHYINNLEKPLCEGCQHHLPIEGSVYCEYCFVEPM